MVFEKTCPICDTIFHSLESYMGHIKDNHNKESPEKFVQRNEETKWSFRGTD